MERDAAPRDRFYNNEMDDIESKSVDSNSSKEIDDKTFNDILHMSVDGTEAKKHPYSHLRDIPLLLLDTAKIGNGYLVNYTYVMILLPLLACALATNLDSFLNFIDLTSEALQYSYQKRNMVVKTLSTFQLTIFDLLCILVLLKKVRRNTPDELLKMRKYYVTLLKDTNSTGRVQDSKKAYAVQTKVERIIAPKRRKFTNLLGEYIYECFGPNIICVINGLLINKFSQYYNLTLGNKVASGDIFWVGLMAIQFSNIIVFLDTHVASKRAFDNFYVTTLLFTIVGYGFYIQKLLDIFIMSATAEFNVVFNIIILIMFISAFTSFAKVLNRMKLFHMLRYNLFMVFYRLFK